MNAEAKARGADDPAREHALEDGISYPGTPDDELAGMPIGGLGTSTFEIGRHGAFRNNRLQNAWSMSLPYKPTGMAPGAFLSLFVKPEGESGQGRLLQLEAVDELAGVQATTYTGRFPFVDLDYDEPAWPADVRLEAFSPFVPLNADDSSLPIAFLTVTVRNRSDRPLTATAALSWANDIAYEYYFKGWPQIGNRNEIMDCAGAPGVRMTTRDPSLAGSEYLLAGVAEHGVSWQSVADWWPRPPGRVIGRNLMVDADDPNARPGFRPTDAWTTFLEQGKLPDEDPVDDGLDRFSQHRPVGAVAGGVTVAPGEEREVKFALAWFFPHHYDRQSGTGRVFLGHRYAQRFPGGATEVMASQAPRRDDLRARSREWRGLFAEATLPPSLRALITETLYLLPRLSWWTADDAFYLLESINCPRVVCVILDRYCVSTLCSLFPELHANLLRNVARAQLPSGEIPSTLGVTSAKRHEYRVFNAGDAGIFPLAIGWHARWCDEPGFVDEMYPVLKNTLHWGARELDDNADGIPDVHGLDQGWDDFVMYGSVFYIADQWLAALRVGEDLAQRRGDGQFAQWCRAAIDKASEFVNEHLYNGDYYSLSYDPKTGDASTICFTDAFTYGSVSARMLDLGDLHPAERIRQTLSNIWRLNVRPVSWVLRASSNADGTPASRSGRKKRRDGPSQSNAFSTVDSIPLACAALQQGMCDEGMDLLADLAHTWVNRLRDPWSCRLLYDSTNGEWFYGLHYSDCLIAWDVLYVLLGMTIDAPNATLAFRPPRLPVCMPVFGRLFTGQVRIDEDGVELRSASDAPCTLNAVSAQAPDGRSIAPRPVTLPPHGRHRMTW